MFSSRFMPCTACGDSVERSTESDHRCRPSRRVDYLMFQLRDRVAEFEPQLHRFLASSRGRFETWLAARDVAASTSDSG
jgi:hypothetical protein